MKIIEFGVNERMIVGYIKKYTTVDAVLHFKLKEASAMPEIA